MPQLTRAQVATYAAQAGFSGNALNIAVAIAQAESGFNSQATNHNTNGSTDYGLWQINSVHSQYNPAQLLSSPLYNAQAAYAISNRGQSFTAWVTFNTGAYKRYLTNVSPSGGGNMPLPVSLNWAKLPVTHGYITTHLANDPDSPHYAVDIGMPFHTTIGSAVNGKVYQADYAVWSGQPGGGEVFIHNDAGGPDWYVYHLDQITVSVGQHVSVGTVIGLSGGQNSGGSHPVSPMWSTGPHLHTGWFTGYKGSVIGSRPYGPDFTPYLNQLKAGNVPATGGPVTAGNTNGGQTYVPPTGLLSNDIGNTLQSLGALLYGQDVFAPVNFLDQVHQTLIDTPGFYGIALALDEAEQFPGYENLASSPFDVIGIIRSVGATVSDNGVPFLIRSGLVTLGMTILILLLIKVVFDVGEKVAPLVEGAAMLAA